ncbi:FUSC family protein [Zestomonas carbonaria]|uniref:p-hydroxybenzoic acid efflux pump subunit AaeB n=1 Tax=Zestomonas carbonaria TaxID=2762745 RepID=A0A7U7EQ51_9GAMM|nr:FUSC family protein [Pseudomonas carbonaria]CAD5108718.1 p-hydroxybenzoic acid efflux pump subunit AaeB [Pseudomonas carbonaria]
MKGLYLSPALPGLDALRRAFYEWARSDGLTWIYIAKVLCAAFLTLWLAMRLELPQPSTACVTVFIVMQPQSGQVFAKSFYRLIGSLIGLSVMIVLVALFAQERVLFLLSAAIWIGLCTAGAARYRDFRAYACVLAGYTATLIGIPATTQPEAAFMQAIWRLLEISLAVGCSTLVSAVLLPQTTTAAMRNALYLRFGAFAGFMLDGLRRKLDRNAFVAGNVRFSSEAVGLEAMRTAGAFEDPHTRLRSRRLARLNSEFMTLTTRFHALHQLRERLLGQSREDLLAAIRPCLAPLEEILETLRDRPLTVDDAGRLAERLERLRQEVRAAIRMARAQLGEDHGDALLDFDSAAELLYRLVDDLHDYALTHASLSAHRHEREQWEQDFTPKANLLASVIAGLRTGMVVLLFGTFWIVTAWPSGGMFALNAVAILALVSSSPNPPHTAMQMAGGTALAAVLGIFVGLFVLPRIDGFVMLCLVIAPVFVLGAFLSTRPRWAGYGPGLLIFFCIGALPANHTVFDPSGLINNYIALLLSMIISAAVIAVVLPPNAPWMWRRLENDLRRRIVHAVSAPAQNLVTGFESGTRDLVVQAYGLASSSPAAQHNLLRWMFLVLEAGHAVIELRREQDELPDAPAYADNAPWRRATRVLGRALIRLFVQPSADNRQRALNAVQHAIDRAQAAAEPYELHFEQAPVRRVLSYLHFIRTSLLDPNSPLPPLPAPEPSHAA